MSSTDLKPPYKKPPIVEAVIAMHFATPLEKKWIEKFSQKKKSALPHHEQIIHVNLNVNEQAIDVKRNVAGCRLRSEDQSRISILLPETMSTSQLAPYLDWEHLYAEAKDDWDVLKKIAGHIKLSRVSTRFINRIDIPFASPISNLDISKYFNSHIVLPSDLKDGAMQNFNFMFALTDKSNRFISVIKIAIAPPALIDHISIILDIDTYTTISLSEREDEIWALINEMRQLKNDSFEACITPATRNLFQ